MRLSRRPADLTKSLVLGDELATLGSASAWINSPALSAATVKGKVVLVQFWTFTCINWLRTLPYTRAWAQSYRNSGLVVIGVHTPEFAFEHELENVRRAAADMKVEYPVVQHLHQLIRQPKPIVDRVFRIEYLDPAIEAFSFAFG